MSTHHTWYWSEWEIEYTYHPEQPQTLTQEYWPAEVEIIKATNLDTGEVVEDAHEDDRFEWAKAEILEEERGVYSRGQVTSKGRGVLLRPSKGIPGQGFGGEMQTS